MKPVSPHDPLDDLIAAALHGELTPEECTQFDSRLKNDPAAQAAYQKAQLMHDLLEKTHQNAQPDSDFERRMVSGVRRKLQSEQHRETAWESLLVLWTMTKKFIPRRKFSNYAMILALVSVVSLTTISYMGNQVKGVFTTISSQLAYAGSSGTPANAYYDSNADARTVLAASQQKSRQEAQLASHSKDLKKVIQQQGINYVETAQKGVTLSGYLDSSYTSQFAGQGQYAPQGFVKAGNGTLVLRGTNAYTGGTSISAGTLAMEANTDSSAASTANAPASPTPTFSIPRQTSVTTPNAKPPAVMASITHKEAEVQQAQKQLQAINNKLTTDKLESAASTESPAKAPVPKHILMDTWARTPAAITTQDDAKSDKVSLASDAQAQQLARNDAAVPAPQLPPGAAPAAEPAPVIDTRKLIRNAQLDLEVKNYQIAVDEITTLTKQAGGYVDTSNSQKGGNGKLQGTVVAKVLPQFLDAFLLKLRDLGELRNQSVSTDDVTKDYFDTTARLENSRKMEIQLQELLKRNNGKVSELLQVEREIGRVRGEIEQMQGQLKLYDFQVQFATVTINMREKDLNQAAAYLLKEQDQFALFASNVEDTFQQTRKTADDFKAQILSANLNHESGSNVSADMVIMVAPEQIEPFLEKLRALGRVANFTRETQRVARDGGDSDRPADQTLTEKDKVQVQISIRSDDESRKQVGMTVVTQTVDTALDEAKTTALDNAAEILSSSLNKTPQGESAGQLSVRVPGKNFNTLIKAYRALGRTASFSLRREDNSGPGVNNDEAPVIISLSLTDTDAPVQVAEMSVLGNDIDTQSQQLKRDAAADGVQVTGSNFSREPNGMEVAMLIFRMPMSKYPSFVEGLKKLGHVESLTVQRSDRPDQTRPDDNAPVEIGLRLHNQGDIVADNNGLWATLRKTFGEGAGALFGSVRVIGVLVAYVIPWLLAVGLVAWVGRRIYIWKKK